MRIYRIEKAHYTYNVAQVRLREQDKSTAGQPLTHYLSAVTQCTLHGCFFSYGHIDSTDIVGVIRYSIP